MKLLNFKPTQFCEKYIMRDYMHELAARTTNFLGRNKCYTEEEATVITYGTELFFNSVLKAIIYLTVGLISGKFLEVVVAIGVFGGLRVLAGGIHAKTDSGCFVMTGLIILFAVVSPMLISFTTVSYIAVIVTINFLYIGFTPRDEYYESHKDVKTKQKIKVVILVNIILLLSCGLNNYWKTIVTVTILEEGLTLLLGGKNEQKKKCS